MHRIHRALGSRLALVIRARRDRSNPRWTNTHSVTSLRLGLLANQLDHRHLHQLVHARDLVKVVEEVSDGRGLRDAAEGHERIALASGIGFLRQAMQSANR
jgi:hypothetical protein